MIRVNNVRGVKTRSWSDYDAVRVSEDEAARVRQRG